MNFLVVRQGWTNASTKAVAARKASSMPGRLSSIPTTTAAIASKPQIARRISALILLLGVEKASLMTVSFLDCGFRLCRPTLCIRGQCAGVDSAWEQYKPEASLPKVVFSQGKILDIASHPATSVACYLAA